jgi:hypothetical protein
MLKRILERQMKHPDEEKDKLFHDLKPGQVVEHFRQELQAFWLGEYPFKKPDTDVVENPLEWWRKLQNHDHARVLAVCLSQSASKHALFLLIVFLESSLQSKSFQSLLIRCQMNERIRNSPGSMLQTAEAKMPVLSSI